MQSCKEFEFSKCKPTYWIRAYKRGRGDFAHQETSALFAHMIGCHDLGDGASAATHPTVYGVALQANVSPQMLIMPSLRNCVRLAGCNFEVFFRLECKRMLKLLSDFGFTTLCFWSLSCKPMASHPNSKYLLLPATLPENLITNKSTISSGDSGSSADHFSF